VKDHQINPVPGVADAQPLLACHEAEVVAELEQKGFETADESVFEIGFRLFVCLHKRNYQGDADRT
jgi:hypothetical protein